MDNSTVIKKVLGVINLEGIVSIVRFGKKDGSDIDLFVLVRDDIWYATMNSAELDITTVGIGYFHSSLYLFDPHVTEPLLTGEVIYGKSFDEEIRGLKKDKASIHAISHLHEMSRKVLGWSEQNAKGKKYKDSLVNIVFALSYGYFAKNYASDPRVITFQELLERNRNSLLNNAHAYLKSGIHNPVWIGRFLIKAKEDLAKIEEYLTKKR